VAVLVITASTFVLRRRWPAVFVAWMTYALLLLPVSGIAHGGGQIVADRYSYIPCLSFALLAGSGIVAAWHAARNGRLGRGAVRLVAAGVCVILFAFAGMTSAQISVWHDSTSLWEHAYSLHPIERLWRAGAAREAERRAYEATVSTLGNLSAYWAICYNLGTTLRTDRRIDEAAEVYARGAAVNAANADIRNSWAAALMDLRRYDEAVVQLDAAIRLEPTHAKAYYNLGLARAGQGRAAEADAAYRRSIALDPEGGEAHYNLGLLLAGQGKLDEAAVEYRRAIALRPNYAEAFNNLGVALIQLGHASEAVDAFRQAVALDPGNEGARQNLSKALALLKGGR
jgi:tetratricopeptide (TPR) repeat protein